MNYEKMTIQVDQEKKQDTWKTKKRLLINWLYFSKLWNIQTGKNKYQTENIFTKLCESKANRRKK